MSQGEVSDPNECDEKNAFGQAEYACQRGDAATGAPGSPTMRDDDTEESCLATAVDATDVLVCGGDSELPCCSYTGPDDGGLGFGPQTWALISVLGDVSMLFGAWMYGAFLTMTPLRPLFFLLQLFNAAAAVPDLLLSLGVHEQLSIPASVFAPIGMMAFWLAWQLKVLPIYTLAARICPRGVEATLMAIISATNDVGGTVRTHMAPSALGG
jgi:hypothetical protein